MRPSEAHIQKLHDLANWSRDEMGLGKSWQDVKSGNKDLSQHMYEHLQVKDIVSKAITERKKNPHVKESLGDTCRRIHKEQQEKEAAKKKSKGSK